MLAAYDGHARTDLYIPRQLRTTVVALWEKILWTNQSMHAKTGCVVGDIIEYVNTWVSSQLSQLNR